MTLKKLNTEPLYFSYIFSFLHNSDIYKRKEWENRKQRIIVKEKELEKEKIEIEIGTKIKEN